ncbi:transmembrane protein 14C [Esox lucius]|uniref:Transmembrane protein 14C n=1 Tax=Esox lucius TaxID=8010 RepID=A0AAY5K7C4_ESOLU|nr:transmembrane protein 14C [Esox lucius]
MSIDWIGYSYAALVSIGGIIGFVKAGSVTSLVAGLFFGALAGIGAYLTSRSPKNVWLSLGTSGTLALVMGMRFLNSWKFMPAGLMTVASLLMLGKTAAGTFKNPHNS